MPSIITAAQLRSVLGVSSSLYSDAYLEDICDTAEAVVMPMLNQWSVGVVAWEVTSNVATVYTQAPHGFIVGQTVTISNVHAQLNGSKTITVAGELNFSYAVTHANQAKMLAIPPGIAAANDLTQYAGIAPIESANLAVAVEVFQSRVAPGGSIEGVDFVPQPFKLGRSLFNRVTGLLGAYLDVEAICQ